MGISLEVSGGKNVKLVPVFYLRMYNLSWETEEEDDYHHYRRSRDDYRRMRRRRSRSGDREDEVRIGLELHMKSNSKLALNFYALTSGRTTLAPLKLYESMIGLAPSILTVNIV